MTNENLIKNLNQTMFNYDHAKMINSPLSVMQALKKLKQKDVKLRVPISIRELENYKDQAMPLVIPYNDQFYLPIFTHTPDSLEEFRGIACGFIEKSYDEIADLIKDDKCEGCYFNPETDQFLLPKDLYNEIKEMSLTSTLSYYLGSVDDLKVDEVVFGIVDSLVSATKPAYSQEITEDEQRIIQTVIPEIEDEDDIYTLIACYQNSLTLAKNANAHSIVFEILGVKEIGLDVEIAVRSAVAGILEWFEDNPDYQIDVYLACKDFREYNENNKLAEM